MSYAYKHDGEWIPITGEFTIGNQAYIGDWLHNETPETLAEDGIYFIGEEDNPKPGVRGARHIEERDGKPIWVYKILPVFNDAERAARKAEIDTHIQAAFGLGFEPSHPDFKGERLQLRDESDRTNWLTAKSEYSDQVAAGHGDVKLAKFRTMANKTIFVTFSEALVILKELTAWGFAITERGWALKDAEIAGDEYDVTIGWPEQPAPSTEE